MHMLTCTDTYMEINRNLPSSDSLPKCLQWLGMAQIKSRNQELSASCLFMFKISGTWASSTNYISRELDRK